MVAVKNPEIRRAVETLYQLSADGQVQAEHERRMKAMRDYASEMNGAYLEGKQDGRMDTALEAARKMKANNVPVEQIIEYLGLTEEQIKNLC